MENKDDIIYHNRLWYKKVYEALVNKGLNRILEKDIYVERHHILPKCMGGMDEDRNFVMLTAREHIIAHMLLSCMYPDNVKLCYAVTIMLSGGKHDSQNLNRKEAVSRISSRLIGIFREEAAKSRKGKKHTEESKKKMSLSLKGKGIGRKHSAETRKKMSDSRQKLLANEDSLTRKTKYASRGHLGKSHTEETRRLFSKLNTGRKHSNATKDKMSKSRLGKKNPMYGKTFSEEHKRKMSESRIGRAVTEVTKQKLRTWYKNHNHTSAKKVIGPNGEVYRSLAECAREVGKSSATLLNWIRNSPEKGYKYL